MTFLTRGNSTIILLAGLALSSTEVVMRQANAIILYDNLDQQLLEGPEGDFINVLSSDRLHAQQFVLGDNNRINRVSVRLTRQGDATGSLGIELWSDTGSDDPNAKIADVGSVPDVTVIGEISSVFTFGTVVDGLMPNDNYWVVLNYSGLDEPVSFDRSVGWMFAISPHRQFTPEDDGYMVDMGTNGAAFMHGFGGTGPWVDFPEFFGLDALYGVMSVANVPEPSALILMALGLFILSLYRLRPLLGERSGDTLRASA